MLAEWEEHGRSAVTTFRTERPHDFVKLMAGLVPRQFNMKVNELEHLSDEQLTAQLRAVLGELAADGMELGPGDKTTAGPQPPGAVPPLH